MTSDHFRGLEKVKNPNSLAGIMAAQHARHDMREDKNIKGADKSDSSPYSYSVML